MFDFINILSVTVFVCLSSISGLTCVYDDRVWGRGDAEG